MIKLISARLFNFLIFLYFIIIKRNLNPLFYATNLGLIDLFSNDSYIFIFILQNLTFTLSTLFVVQLLS